MSILKDVGKNTTGPDSRGNGGRTIITTGKNFPATSLRAFVEFVTIKNVQIIDIDTKIKYMLSMVPELQSLQKDDIVTLVRTIIPYGKYGAFRYNISLRNNIRDGYKQF